MCVGEGESGREAGGRARGRRAGSEQPRHQDSARPRRLAAPPRYWRRRSRAISLRHQRLGSAGAAAPTTRRQREPGGGDERPRSGPRGERAPPAPSPPPPAPPPPALLPPASESFSPPPAAAAATAAAAAAATAPPTTSGQLGRGRLRESSAVSATPPSYPPRAAEERRLRQTSACSRPPLPLRPGLVAPRPVKPFPVAAFLTLESGHSRSTLGVVVLGGLREAGPGASGLRGVGAAFGRRTVGREGRHRGLNAERRQLRVRPEAQRRRGRGALRESAAAPAPRAPRGGRKAPNWAAGTVAAEPRRAAAEVALSRPLEPGTAAECSHSSGAGSGERG